MTRFLVLILALSSLAPAQGVGQSSQRHPGLPHESEAAFRQALELGGVSATVRGIVRAWETGHSREGISPEMAAEILYEVATNEGDGLVGVHAMDALAAMAHIPGRTSQIAEQLAIDVLERPGGNSPTAARILARLPDNRGIPRLIALLEHPALCRIGLGSLMEWAGPAGHAALRAFDPARIPNEDMRQALVEFQQQPGG